MFCSTIKYVAEGSKAKEGIPVASAKITAGRSGAGKETSSLLCVIWHIHFRISLTCHFHIIVRSFQK